MYMYMCEYIFVCMCPYVYVVRYSWSPLGMSLLRARGFKARTSLLPRFGEKGRSSFELWALYQRSRESPQVGWAVYVCAYVYVYAYGYVYIHIYIHANA